VFKVLTLSVHSSVYNITGPPPATVTLSAADSVKTLFRHLANAFPTYANLPFRIWLIEAQDLEGSVYPISKLLTVGATLVPEINKSIEAAALGSGDTFVVEFKHGSDWVVHESKVKPEGTSFVMTADVPPPLFSSENDFFSRFSKGSSSPKPKTTSTITNHIMSKLSSSGFAGSSSFGSSNIHNKFQEPGTIGLGNM